MSEKETKVHPREQFRERQEKELADADPHELFLRHRPPPTIQEMSERLLEAHDAMMWSAPDEPGFDSDEEDLDEQSAYQHALHAYLEHQEAMAYQDDPGSSSSPDPAERRTDAVPQDAAPQQNEPGVSDSPASSVP